MKLLSTLFTAAALISGNAQAGNTEDIQALVSAYETAANNADVAAVMDLYGNEPTFMAQNSPAAEGRAAVEQAYKATFDAIHLNIRFQVHALEVLGDTAWLRTSSTGKIEIQANGAVIDEGNHELFILKSEDGDWKIHQYLFATALPQ